ncbi:MAG: hypothetical protein N3J91_09625 [Verrucomicrobiae bacterium]|nr:hypothetical protein [Verrucomicrobiae bacterium]
MGILVRYQVKAGGWRANVELPWELDLDRAAVGGVALRDPATLLWKLGPGEDPAAAAAAGRYCYFTRGAEAEVAHQRLRQWRIYWHDPAGHFSPFAGPCRFRGGPIDLHGGLPETALAALLGPPVWRDETAAQVRLFYAHHATDWEVLLSPAHGLQQITLSAQPLYARTEAGQAPPAQPT